MKEPGEGREFLAEYVSVVDTDSSGSRDAHIFENIERAYAVGCKGHQTKPGEPCTISWQRHVVRCSNEHVIEVEELEVWRICEKCEEIHVVDHGEVVVPVE